MPTQVTQAVETEMLLVFTFFSAAGIFSENVCETGMVGSDWSSTCTTPMVFLFSLMVKSAETTAGPCAALRRLEPNSVNVPVTGFDASMVNFLNDFTLM